jgi:thiol-disulfide isomerase/thioredoxin
MNTSYIKTKLLPLVTVTLALWAFVGLTAPPKEGDTFPDLSKFGLEGTLPDTKGKVVIVDFFASWCEPCKESFPAMEALKQKYGDKGLVIIAVNLDKKKADMEDFVAKHPVTFTIVRDVSNKLVNEVKIPTMPSSFVLDKTGRVHSFHRGFKGAETTKKYAEEIEALLK